MKKGFLTAALVAFSFATLRADLTFVQTTTMEGAAAAMMQPGQLPKITMRLKGQKARSDIEVMGQTITAITDLAQKQVVMLDSAKKTATVMTSASVASGGPTMTMPDIDVSLKATGKTQTIEGQPCDEHVMTLKLDMASLGGPGGQMPPEAAAAMKDVKMVMSGSIWIAKNAPGAGEYMAFNKAAVESNLLAMVSGMKPGQSGGLDKVMAAAASAPGLPYLTEITMSFEGSGPMVQAMGAMGPMKMVQKVSSVSTAAIADDIFTVPAGYTVEKK